MNKNGNVAGKVVLAGFFFLTAGGCAFQSDVTDLHLEMDQLKDKMARVNLTLDANERVVKDRVQTTTKEQGDAFLKLDQIGVDLQTIQGRIEENNHSLSDLSQKTEEQSLRINDQNSRLGNLENRMVMLEKSGQTPQISSSPEEQGKMILQGKSLDSTSTSSPATTLSPQEAYNLAYSDFVKGNYDLALLGFLNFTQQFQNSVLMANALYWLGESYFNKKEFPKAIETFDRVARDYPKHDKTPGSILKEGYAYFEMGEKLRGTTYLKKVIEQYPRSNEAQLAKEKLATAR
ncbi:MAG: tol-pal system protein YbgF [Nitrospirae bacterium]|nr:tol-pal system protein YbgF [Nitrospirota bacterium]MBI3353203.1 tol-pal system protein YbgF [Nitrospirota bacterium]